MNCVRAVSGVLFAGLCVAAAGRAPALGPHELLLLVNAASSNSVRLAADYAAWRGLPSNNLVALRPGGGAWPSSITAKVFEQDIWNPAWQAARERGIADRILAWAFSADFPTTVAGKPPLSLTGQVFCRNRRPPDDAIVKGAWGTPLFAGPDYLGARIQPPQSLDLAREWLGADMPLPAMMLAVLGERANTITEARAALRAATAADGARPTGIVYFVTGATVRVTARQWQFPAARAELERAGVTAALVAAPPPGATIWGLLHGSELVTPDPAWRFAPGAMADHLTSWAGAFDHAGQTKLTVWLAAGAATSAGTVTEPYAVWSKFPNARFFVHYAAGCTALEAYAQSIRCPLQILLVGDPLCAPWKPRASVVIAGTGEGVAGAEYQATVTDNDGSRYTRFLWLLNGRVVGSAPVWRAGPSDFDGRRAQTLRAIAYRAGFVRTQAFAERIIGAYSP